MNAILTRIGLAGFVFATMAILSADSTNAQCATGVTPTVAYQPVVAQPTTVYQPVATTQYTGWYPGKLFDRMRLRNYGVATPVAPAAPVFTPTTTSYVPYTASYPVSTTGLTHTAGFTPYVSAFAPLRRTVVARPLVQTAYYPVVAASPCSNCVQTVARPVILSPVVQAGYAASAAPPCGGCSTGITSAAAPNYVPTLSPAPVNQGGIVGPPTPQPQLGTSVPAPAQSNYPKTPSTEDQGHEEKSILDPLDKVDPMPEKDLDTDASFQAPRLFDPSDRTTRRSSNGPSVDVWNAVYHKSSAGQVNQTSYKSTRTQAEIDAEGWQSVPRSR